MKDNQPENITPERAAEVFQWIKQRLVRKGAPEHFATRQARIQTYDFLQKKKGLKRSRAARLLHDGLEQLRNINAKGVEVATQEK